MTDFVNQHLTEILAFIAGLAGGSFLTLVLKRNNVKGGGSVVDQSRSRAGGDVVGGDKTTNSRK